MYIFFIASASTKKWERDMIANGGNEFNNIIAWVVMLPYKPIYHRQDSSRDKTII